MTVRRVDDPENLKHECGCGRPISEVYYCKKCNLCFCGFCDKRHDCKPVNGPITRVEPGPTVLLPQTPAPAALQAHPLQESKVNGSHKSTPKRWRKKR